MCKITTYPCPHCLCRRGVHATNWVTKRKRMEKNRLAGGEECTQKKRRRKREHRTSSNDNQQSKKPKNEARSLIEFATILSNLSTKSCGSFPVATSAQADTASIANKRMLSELNQKLPQSKLKQQKSRQSKQHALQKRMHNTYHQRRWYARQKHQRLSIAERTLMTPLPQPQCQISLQKHLAQYTHPLFIAATQTKHTTKRT